MSQPKRYSVAVDDPWFGNGAYIQEDGKYVLYSDYAALAAELDVLKNGDDALLEKHKLNKHLILQLRLENERLRKAGDAMASALAFEYRDSPKVADWLAAKEGR